MYAQVCQPLSSRYWYKPALHPGLQEEARRPLLSDDVVYRVPEELWTEEVSNIVQQAMTKTTPKKMKCKKAKWLSEEVLQIAEERRKAKGKGGRERYTNCMQIFRE